MKSLSQVIFIFIGFAIATSKGDQIIPSDMETIPMDHPAGVAVDGNDVFVAEYFNGYINHFNSQVGGGTTSVDKIKFPVNYPIFLDIFDGYLYVTATFSGVYRMPLMHGDHFEKVITQAQAVAIKWQKRGGGQSKLLVGEWETGRVNVFNEDFDLINTFEFCETYPREITIDPEGGNIRITSYTDKVCIYDPCSYELIEEVSIPDAINTEGYYVDFNDRSMIMADRAGKILFLDKNFNTIDVMTGFNSPCDVARTDDGSVYITDYGGHKVYFHPYLN